MPSFQDFPLQPAIRAMLAKMEILEPTPVQAEAIPALLAGNDLVGRSATGSGKTLAYGIPLVERLSRKERGTQALVLLPTRELALQVNAVLSKLADGRRLRTALLVGGRGYGPQISALRSGAQIVVGTPGRIKDHLERGSLVLTQLRLCVLDEADQMLDSGFAPDIEEILTTTPETRQMALFSATMPDWVEQIQQKFLKEPVRIDITSETGEQSNIEQIAYQVSKEQKMAALCTLLHSTEGGSSLIFGKTKYGVERLGKQLSKLGFTVGTLHGDKSQRAREEVLTAFRRGQVQTLLATNVAARGLDIQGIAQVINYELPESSELFTHRIGRTGRMGRQGKAITLLIPSDVPKWRRMARDLHPGQKVALQKLTIDEDALAPESPEQPEVVMLQEYEASFEQRDEQRPARDRKQPMQENGKRVQPEYDRAVASGKKQPRRERNDVMASGKNQRQKERRLEIAFSETRQQKERGDSMASGQTRRQKEHSFREVPAWSPEEEDFFQERPASGRGKDDGRKQGRQANLSVVPGKRKAPPSGTKAAQRTASRKPGAPPSIRARRNATSKRARSR